MVHFALIAKAEPIEFDKAVTNKMWVKAMKEEIDSIENIRPGNWWILLQIGSL